MVRRLEVVVPSSRSNEIRDVLMMNRSVHQLSYRQCVSTSESHNGAQGESVVFSFTVVNKKSQELIELLTMYGVSSRFGHFNVFALASTKPRITTIKERGDHDENDPLIKKKRKYQISDSLGYDEVYDTIDDTLHLTFDYLALSFSGGIIAACGLLTDNPVVVVASMLVSPLMGPIVGMTFGAIIKDKTMFYKSFYNELIGILVIFLSGALMGFICAPFIDNEDEILIGPNTQITQRGEFVSLAWGAGIAAPSGVAVAIGFTSDSQIAIIGVAISAALLPPIVNSGVCLASSLVYFLDSSYDVEVVQLWFSMGYISMLLFMLNWIMIFICGIITFRAKNFHHSANEQVKMKRLNKFYELSDGVNGAQQQQQALGTGASLDSSQQQLLTHEQKVALVATKLRRTSTSDRNIGEISTTSPNLIETVSTPPVMIGITETKFSKKKALLKSSSYESSVTQVI